MARDIRDTSRTSMGAPATDPAFPKVTADSEWGASGKRYRRVMGASTLTGDSVRNPAGEDLGKIEEIMIDVPTGRVAYAVLSFGGFLGLGDKLFAVPWGNLTLDED